MQAFGVQDVHGARAALDQAPLLQFRARGVGFAQPLARQSGGGTDFQVRDPDGNAFSFVTHHSAP